MALIVFPAFVVQLVVAIFAAISGNDAISKLAAVFGFLLAAVALCVAFALLLDDARGKEVLPIGRSGPAHHADHGNLALQQRRREPLTGNRPSHVTPTHQAGRQP